MTTEGISNFYGQDHDDLDNALQQFRALKIQDFTLAKSFFKKFKFGLQRHILWEEEILFPLFEEKTGMKDQGPTVVMRQEHRTIETALEDLHQKVRERNADCYEEEERLIALLQAHNYKEENILYPAIDQFSTEPERAGVFQKMQGVAKERYESCGCRH